MDGLSWLEIHKRLAPHLRYAHGRGKLLLREALKHFLKGQDVSLLARETKHGLPSPVNNWMLKKNSFERTDWNRFLLGECIRQMTLRVPTVRRPDDPDRRRSADRSNGQRRAGDRGSVRHD